MNEIEEADENLEATGRVVQDPYGQYMKTPAINLSKGKAQNFSTQKYQ